MMFLRWIWFTLGSCGWILVTVKIWRGEGWMLGVLLICTAFVSIMDWLERTLLKQFKMKRIVTYEEIG